MKEPSLKYHQPQISLFAFLIFLIFNVQDSLQNMYDLKQDSPIYETIIEDYTKVLAVQITLNDNLPDVIVQYYVKCIPNQILIVDEYNSFLQSNRYFMVLPDYCYTKGNKISISVSITNENNINIDHVKAQIELIRLLNNTIPCPFNCYSSQGKGTCNSSTGICECNQKYSGNDCGFPLYSINSNSNIRSSSTINLTKTMQYAAFIRFSSSESDKLGSCTVNFSEPNQMELAWFDRYDNKNHIEVFSLSEKKDITIPSNNDSVFIFKSAKVIKLMNFKLNYECTPFEEFIDTNTKIIISVCLTPLAVLIIYCSFLLLRRLFKKKTTHQPIPNTESENKQPYELIQSMQLLDQVIEDLTYGKLLQLNQIFSETKACILCKEIYEQSTKISLSQDYQILHLNCNKNAKSSVKQPEEKVDDKKQEKNTQSGTEMEESGEIYKGIDMTESNYQIYKEKHPGTKNEFAKSKTGEVKMFRARVPLEQKDTQQENK